MSDSFPIMRPSYRGKHTHAVKRSITGDSWSSLCDTGPNGVRQGIFQGTVEQVTCPQCLKKLRRSGSVSVCKQVPTCNIAEEHDHCLTWRDGVQDDGGSNRSEPDPRTPEQELALLRSDPDAYWAWYERTHKDSPGGDTR